MQWNITIFSHKKNFFPFETTEIDHEGTRVSEKSQTEKDKYHISSPIHVWNLNKTKQSKAQHAHRYREQMGGFQRLVGLTK